MAMEPLMLSLPLSEFERLHKAADRKGKTCSVSRTALAALLMDHSRLLAKIEEAYIKVENVP
jgi:hypothetical protein